MLTRSTITRPSWWFTRRTVPFCPRSFPAITWTVSPFLMRCMITFPYFLQRFGSQRHDLGVASFAQFTRYRPEDAGSARVLRFGFQDHGGIVVETDIRTVVAAIFFRHSDDDGVYHVALLDHTLRRSLLDRGNHHIPDVCITALGAAQHADDQQFARAGIVSDFDARFLLDHGCPSLTLRLFFENSFERPPFGFAQRAGLDDLDEVAF